MTTPLDLERRGVACICMRDISLYYFCPSVCPSHRGIGSKWLHVWLYDHLVGASVTLVFEPHHHCKISREPSALPLNAWRWKKWQISFSLDMAQDRPYSYYESIIESHRWTIDPRRSMTWSDLKRWVTRSPFFHSGSSYTCSYHLIYRDQIGMVTWEGYITPFQVGTAPAFPNIVGSLLPI